MKERGTSPMIMDRVLCWNVRGINTLKKQNEVRSFIVANSVGLVVLLETKVPSKKMGALYINMFNGWCFSSNAHMSKGCLEAYFF